MRDGFITDWPVSERFPHYTRANAGEVMGDPVSPLGWSYGWDGAMVLGMRDGWIRGGTHEMEDFDPEHPETFGMFGGYFFLNLASCRLQGVRNPGVTVEQLDMAFFGDHPDVPPYEAHPDDDKPHLVERIEANTAWVMSGADWPELEQDKEAAEELRRSRGDLGSYTDAELLERARRIRPMLHHLFEQHVVSGSSAAAAPGILAGVGEAIGDPTIPMKILAGIGDVDSALPSHALWDLSRAVRADEGLTSAFDAGIDGVLDRIAAQDSGASKAFLADWDAFMEEFGSRGPNEWDINADSWETKPALALAALDRVRFQDESESPEARHAAAAAQREQVTEEVRARVAGDDELAGMLEAALTVSAMMAYRERTKTTIVKVIHEARMLFRELGRRHAEAGDIAEPGHVFMLLESELDDFVADPASFREILADRAADYAALWDVEPPFIIRYGELPPLSEWSRRSDSEAEPVASGAELVGVSGSPGMVTGTARVVMDPRDPAALEPGDILVAPFTDPSWTPLFMTAGAVVVDVGSPLSHAVIVSRELGLPCVVSATGATGSIPDGATVEVNGDTGVVTVIDS
jgi:phosphohistidine swiveling domain-containing protein